MARTAIVSTYPPRHCAVASFAGELSRVTPDREIVALHPHEPISAYSFEVHHRIRRDERDDYARTAQSLAHCADVASLQFEPSIWGGNDGAFVLDFVEALPIPFVLTLHGVRSDPSPGQRATVRRLVELAVTTVALSSSAVEILASDYGLDPLPIHVIPFGVPDLPIIDAAVSRDAVGVSGRDVILGAGLLAPGKGYERVIDALPAILPSHPSLTFAIVGATHPDVHRHEGEAYRTSLAARAARLGVTPHVRFVDEFVGRVDLTRWLQAADVVVTAYDDLRATHSGILAHAMAAGCAVVATRFPFAVEMLGEGRGVLVADSADALGEALLDLLDDPARRITMGRRAHEHSRDWSWTRVGADYKALFAEAVGGSALGARAGAGVAARA